MERLKQAADARGYEVVAQLSEQASSLNEKRKGMRKLLTLIKEQIAISPESVATFSYAWPAGQPAREFQVRKDQEFSLKPQEEIKYKLIDVQPAKAVIVNSQKPTEQIQIGLAAP